MSGARIQGSMPRPGQILGVLDTHARGALRDVATLVEPLVRAEAPGGLGDAMKATVRKTPTGYRATVAAPRNKPYKGGTATSAQIVRWVNRGTGIYRQGAGPKRPITGRRGVLGRMTLPGGQRVRSVKGQHPNPFIARAEDRARAPVDRALQNGAHKAADALRRL
jgi:hypothetical protein